MNKNEISEWSRVDSKDGVTLLKNLGIHRGQYAIMRDGKIVRSKMRRTTAVTLYRRMICRGV